MQRPFAQEQHFQISYLISATHLSYNTIHWSRYSGVEVTTPRRAIRLGLFLLLELIALSAVLHAGGDWAPVDPAEPQMKDLPEQRGAPAFVLYSEKSITAV
jgi:hypothetical protein